VTYQGQYFRINSHISECDHKCETRNTQPEVGTDKSSQTRQNLWLDVYGSGFGPPRVCGSGFSTVLKPNRHVFAVQTRTACGLPGLVPTTTSTNPSNSDDVTIFPYSCVEGSDARDTVVTMHRYVERDRAVLRMEIFDAFGPADSRSLDVIYMGRYLEDPCAKLEGRGDTEILTSFLHTYNHISGVITKISMMVEYERTVMLMRALPK